MVPEYPAFDTKMRLLDHKQSAGGQTASAMVARDQWNSSSSGTIRMPGVERMPALKTFFIKQAAGVGQGGNPKLLDGMLP